MPGMLIKSWMGLYTGWVVMGAFCGLNVMAQKTVPPEYRVYIGTYNSATNKGIYLARFNPASGRLGDLSLAAETENPSFLALHPSRPCLYAVNEFDALDGRKGGAISAFAIDPGSGALRLLNRVSPGGTGPCHLSVEGGGRCVLVANYGSGSVALIGLRADGGLESTPVAIQHKGRGSHPQWQKGPHAHCFVADPANRFALAADLGMDKIMVYRLDPDRLSLAAADPPSISLPAGYGPRHLVFHPSGRFVYVINELGNAITVMGYDPGRGRLSLLQEIRTLPPDFTGPSDTSEIQISPSGRHLYAANRGHDSLAGYALDPVTGRLTLIGIRSCEGLCPRNFAIDPSGNWLLVGNQKSGSLVVFKVDPTSGQWESTGIRMSIPAPACIVFDPRD